MDLVGKVIKKELKDFGKGKDAEAHEVTVITVKLNSNEGVRGTLIFAPGEDDSTAYDLGDPMKCTVSAPQGKLGLTRGGRSSSASAGH